MLKVLIDEKTKRKYKLRDSISFDDFRIQILVIEAKERLKETNKIAAKVGLHKMSEREIDAEINQVIKSFRPSKSPLKKK